ncbi:MAG TPA: hypothetical protein VJB18_03710 [Burkholderiales bacterium]|nr:hypothetical protein [Burkholderiales bacterium]
MFETILVVLGSGSVSAVVIVLLARTWVETRIKASIEHEYQKQFALFQLELERKQKVALVAELIAEFIKVPQGETLPREQRHALNKLSFQATLWLPRELAVELSKRLQNKPDAKSPFEIILLARKLLTDDATLAPEHVTFWRPDLEKRGDPVIVR